MRIQSQVAEDWDDCEGDILTRRSGGISGQRHRYRLCLAQPPVADVVVGIVATPEQLAARVGPKRDETHGAPWIIKVRR